MQWITTALHELGHEVQAHTKMNIELPHSKPYDRSDTCDIVIYNHATAPQIRGNVIKAKHTWFFKATIPETGYSTLDPLGYGPYSSLTYDRPPFETPPVTEVESFSTSSSFRR